MKLALPVIALVLFALLRPHSVEAAMAPDDPRLAATPSQLLRICEESTLDIIRSRRELEEYIRREDLGHSLSESEIQQFVQDAYFVGGCIGGFNYAIIYEKVTAVQFEQLLAAMGISGSLFALDRDQKCTYSERLGCSYCAPSRGNFCTRSCSADCPR